MQAALNSMSAAREISNVILTSLSSMESDAAQFRDHVNASCSSQDQGLAELAVAYEVCCRLSHLSCWSHSCVDYDNIRYLCNIFHQLFNVCFYCCFAGACAGRTQKALGEHYHNVGQVPIAKNRACKWTFKHRNQLSYCTTSARCMHSASVYSGSFHFIFLPC